jgi:hypothetical protein
MTKPRPGAVIGRPTKRNDAAEEVILRYVRQGSTRSDAAAAARIAEGTLYAWMADFPEFHEAIRQAEGECAVRHALTVQKAATGFEQRETRTATKQALMRTLARDPDGTPLFDKNGKPLFEQQMVTLTEETVVVKNLFDWRASMEWLRRRRRDDWADKTVTDVTGTPADANSGAGPADMADFEQALERAYGPELKSIEELYGPIPDEDR